MGSHLPLGDRQACLPGVERANIRLWRNSRTGSAQNAFAHRIPRPLLCRISSARYTRLDLLAMRDIASRKTVINRFSLALRTCLALGIQSLLITLVVLYARSISSPANIPHLRYAPKSNIPMHHFCGDFSFLPATDKTQIITE